MMLNANYNLSVKLAPNYFQYRFTGLILHTVGQRVAEVFGDERTD